MVHAIGPGVELTLPEGWLPGRQALATYADEAFTDRPGWQGDLRFFEAYGALAEAGAISLEAVHSNPSGMVVGEPGVALAWVALAPSQIGLDEVERRLQSWRLPGQRTVERTPVRTTLGPGSRTVEQLDFSFGEATVIGHHVASGEFAYSVYLIGPSWSAAWLGSTADRIAGSLRAAP